METSLSPLLIGSYRFKQSEPEHCFKQPLYSSFCSGMVPNLETKVKVELVMEASNSKENGGVTKCSGDTIMNCTNNYEDSTFDSEALPNDRTMVVVEIDGMELNITECTNSGDARVNKTEDQDATDCSSSFGDTGSEDENDCNVEVESRFCDGNATSSLYSGYDEIFPKRKKKLTDHWRRFIRPLMWRCKWAELKIKQLQSLAQKYDRELEEYNQRKKLQMDMSKVEHVGSKSLPFSGQSQRKKLMKRKKRKRVEDKVDVASYMSHHNLFSYNGKKRSFAVGGVMDADGSNLVVSTNKTSNQVDESAVIDEWLEVKDEDNSLDKFLRNIEVILPQIHNLKIQIEKVASENAGNYDFADDLASVVAFDAFTSGLYNPTFSLEKEDKILGSLDNPAQNLSKSDMEEEVVMPESAYLVKSMETLNDQGLHEHTEDGTLMHSVEVKEELNTTEEVELQPVEKPPVLIQGPDAPETDGTSLLNVQLILNGDCIATKFNIPKRKRKRRTRKAVVASKWS